MKKIKAIVKDKTTIELVEPGEVGDVIDLKLSSFFSFIYKKIR